MKQLTKEQAIKFAEDRLWLNMSLRQRAEFQAVQKRLCMPFDIFHEAVENTLGRPVFTHEFGLNMDGIKKELFEDARAPTFEEILGMIPEDKRVILLRL
jgi:hypothetical protein